MGFKLLNVFKSHSANGLKALETFQHILPMGLKL